jgi:hypothetical protein
MRAPEMKNKWMDVDVIAGWHVELHGDFIVLEEHAVDG